MLAPLYICLCLLEDMGSSVSGLLFLEAVGGFLADPGASRKDLLKSAIRGWGPYS